LAGAIIELIKNPKIAKKIGENAKKTANIRHNPDKIINNLLNIYNQGLNK